MNNRQSRFGGGGRHRIDFCDVICIDNLLKAWDEFKKGKRKKVDVAEFELNLEDNLFKLHEDLISGKWKPDSYVSFRISDPKSRIIHKASVRDRVLFQAVYRKLYPIFDRNFIFDSYSSRLNGGTHRAVKKLERFTRGVTSNYRKVGFVLKCDIRKFFDSIDHGILLKLISDRVNDEKIIDLIKKIIESFNYLSGKGLPLGNVTSQLFANIYLNELDQFVKHKLKIKQYLRYCDDFILVSESLGTLERQASEIRVFCREKLRLDLHERKVIFRKINQGVDFLGYVVLPYRAVLRTKTKRRIFNKIKSLKSDFEKGKITKESMGQSVQSYLGILSHCKGKKIEEAITNIIK